MIKRLNLRFVTDTTPLAMPLSQLLASRVYNPDSRESAFSLDGRMYWPVLDSEQGGHDTADADGLKASSGRFDPEDRIFDRVVHGACPFKSQRFHITYVGGFLGNRWDMICNYCNAVASGTLTVEFRRMSVFKEPPEGARDLPVPFIDSPSVLFTYAGEARCPNCGAQELFSDKQRFSDRPDY